MITRKICPNCGSEDVFMIAGGVIGNWMCKKCGYTGAILEKEILGREQKTKTNKMKKEIKGKTRGE